MLHSGHIEHADINKMTDARKNANVIEDAEGNLRDDNVKPFFREIKIYCDKLELLVDDEIWRNKIQRVVVY
jgi:glutamine synthetase